MNLDKIVGINQNLRCQLGNKLYLTNNYDFYFRFNGVEI